MRSRSITLLGPQRREPTLAATVADLGLRGRLAAVTAGWEEREGEDQELSEHLGGRTSNLRLYERSEQVLAADPELHAAMRARHDLLRRAQELYRLRLEHAVDAARELLRRLEAESHPEHRELLAEEAREAVVAVRALDDQHVERLRGVHAQFQERWAPLARPHVARHREELGAELARAEAVCIAGGHVAILLNRLRLFGMLELFGRRPLIAWSAGAMALSERVVVFHDSPPQGAGVAEVLEVGLRAFRGLVPLPHADKRLRLEDRTRVSYFAQRFAPDVCALLVKGARLDWDGERWSAAAGTRRLRTDGSCVAIHDEAAA